MHQNVLCGEVSLSSLETSAKGLLFSNVEIACQCELNFLILHDCKKCTSGSHSSG